MTTTATYNSRVRRHAFTQKRARNHNLEEQAQALYKSWFVDFEPFKGGKFVDSELGMIPEGWRVTNLNELVKIISGYPYKGAELRPSTLAMATIKNFDRNGGFKIDGYKELVPMKAKPEQYISLYDLLVAHTDLTQAAEIIGNPAIILSTGGYDKIIMSMDLCKIVSQYKQISNGLLYCMLKDSRFKAHALGYVNGTTVLHMARTATGEYKIACPADISLIENISKQIDNYFKMMSNNLQEQSILISNRDNLLPRLISGELTC
mgnify:CR=1 FL=1